MSASAILPRHRPCCLDLAHHVSPPPNMSNASASRPVSASAREQHPFPPRTRQRNLMVPRPHTQHPTHASTTTSSLPLVLLVVTPLLSACPPLTETESHILSNFQRWPHLHRRILSFSLLLLVILVKVLEQFKPIVKSLKVLADRLCPAARSLR
jgi:hypothetical protein